MKLHLHDMIILLTTKRGKVAVNLDRLLFAIDNGKYTRIELDDGTPIDICESLEEFCALCISKNS